MASILVDIQAEITLVDLEDVLLGQRCDVDILDRLLAGDIGRAVHAGDVEVDLIADAGSKRALDHQEMRIVQHGEVGEAIVVIGRVPRSPW